MPTVEKKAAAKAAKDAEKAAAKAAGAAFAELKKKAKKLKVDFDKDTTEAELGILVSTAEAAAGAQQEKKDGETGSGQVGATTPSDREDVKEAQEKADSTNKAPEVTPAGDTVVQTVVTRNKEKHNLVVTDKGDVQIKNHFGVVTANFDSKDSQVDNIADGKRHLENLSRF